MTEKTRPSLRRWWQTKGAAIAGAPLVLALGAALAAACLVYRVELAGIIYFGKDQPVSLQSAQVPLAAFLKTALPDLLAVVCLTLVFAAGKIWMETRTKLWRDRPFTRLVEGLAVVAVVLGFTLLLRVHFQLLLQLETGLTFTLVVLASRSVGWGDFVQMISVRDAVFILAPLAVFLLVLKYPGWLRRNQRRLLVGGFAAGLALQLLPTASLAPEIAENAGTYFLKDVLNDARKTWFAPPGILSTPGVISPARRR